MFNGSIPESNQKTTKKRLLPHLSSKILLQLSLKFLLLFEIISSIIVT
jgi:hypothetical protein